jgi:acyl-homoserine lactone acylase PvdQ
MVTIFTNPIQSFTSSPYGQSENPDSKHYADQAVLLSTRQFKPAYFNKNDLMKHLESKTVLHVNLLH